VQARKTEARGRTASKSGAGVGTGARGSRQTGSGTARNGRRKETDGMVKASTGDAGQTQTRFALFRLLTCNLRCTEANKNLLTDFYVTYAARLSLLRLSLIR